MNAAVSRSGYIRAPHGVVRSRTFQQSLRPQRIHPMLAVLLPPRGMRTGLNGSGPTQYERVGPSSCRRHGGLLRAPQPPQPDEREQEGDESVALAEAGPHRLVLEETVVQE